MKTYEIAKGIPHTCSPPGKPYVIRVGREVVCVHHPNGREIALRNVGVNTLFFGLDQEPCMDVACGTSWDQKVQFERLYLCTRIGETLVNIVVLG